MFGFLGFQLCVLVLIEVRKNFAYLIGLSVTYPNLYPHNSGKDDDYTQNKSSTSDPFHFLSFLYAKRFFFKPFTNFYTL